MKQFLKVAAMAACVFSLGACGGSEDEPALERKIAVSCYESMAPKGSEFYNPKEWSYTSTMLFNCQPSDIDKTSSTASLANGVATLTDGQTMKAQYKSDTGVICDADYGQYTLVVYCTDNPFNTYLEHRWSCQLLNYSEANSITSLSCCFVWEDMATGGGCTTWQTK